MSAIEQQDSHRSPSDGGMAKEEFIRVGTTLYKIVEQPRLNGGYVKKRIAWNNETLRQPCHVIYKVLPDDTTAFVRNLLIHAE